MSKSLITLWAFKDHKLEPASQKIRDLQEALEKARKELQDVKKEIKEDIINGLDAGKTTGDPFQDQILRFWDFESDAVRLLVDFNQKLIKAKGKEFIVLVRTERRVRYGGDFDPQRDTVSEYYCVLGILSGDPLVIIPGNKDKTSQTEVSVSLPFSRYVKGTCSDMGENCIESDQPYSGPCVLSPTGFLPSGLCSTSLLYTITNIGEIRTSVSVGDEVLKNSDPVVMLLEILRGVLSTPAKAREEQAVVV